MAIVDMEWRAPRKVATLSDNAAKARYGVAYLRSLCSQAGVGFGETDPDEDVAAVDGEVKFFEANVRFQIKCTSKFKISGKSASWVIEPEWREKWNRSQVPVYLILVIIDPELRADWLTHHEQGTLHRSAAFWTRVDKLDQHGSISVPKSNRLTVETFSTWHRELMACFAPPAREGIIA
ncbi:MULTISPECIES: DUF4365 domain-containing protein [Amycolatopsis]|uniref:DUF4365 domain-containing protein n=1 Tax=Amycolatopsis TaxID=1813 RepID=UPI000B8B57E6|nr:MULTISPECIES: DUF4365 domain-containing protein [Amycolatopsis]OXM66195.1 hypothetical protein CF166_27660 [Amycolatopsis sp. KNN50.9b]